MGKRIVYDYSPTKANRPTKANQAMATEAGERR
jgi:hypothetical protein